MGWESPDYGQSSVYIDPSEGIVNSLLREKAETSIHIFSSLTSNRAINKTFRRAARMRLVLGVLSEGRDWRGVKGKLRQGHSCSHERSWVKHVSFVLAIGSVGERWYRDCGFPQSRILPFCYVVDCWPSAEMRSVRSENVQLIYAGQIIERKNLHLLFKALASLPMGNWRLQVIGDGPEKNSLIRYASLVGIGNKVDFFEFLPNEEVQNRIHASDLLVLPSRWDGWGAVANEALMRGVPVLCSDFCGASELIIQDFNGDVFACNSLDSLVNTLMKWISRGKLDEKRKEQIQSWSKRIHGHAVARYFIDSMKFVEGSLNEMPTPPWHIS